MAEIIFKAFLSCSFAQEDKEVIDFFNKLISSFGIEPQIYNYQEIGRIPDKIKENIIKCDCLIAIATRRKKIESSNYWTCPDWIQHEIALANAYNKPIAIFFEEDVKIEGLIGIEERREKFVRSNLIKDIHKITTFLFKLRKFLESTYQVERLEIPVLLRHYIHVKEEMLSKELVIIRSEILMESLIDGLEATHHSIELEDMTSGLSIRPKQYDIVVKEMPSGMKWERAIIQDTDHQFLWKIMFSPHLKKGEKVRYAFKYIRPNCRPYTYEELSERIKQGTYEYKEPICEACEWHISYPTAELKYESSFPENYEIENYYPDVKIGKADLKAENELKRIREGNLFIAEKIIDKWILSFNIPKPIQNHTYYIYYTPPRDFK